MSIPLLDLGPVNPHLVAADRLTRPVVFSDRDGPHRLACYPLDLCPIGTRHIGRPPAPVDVRSVDNRRVINDRDIRRSIDVMAVEIGPAKIPLPDKRPVIGGDTIFPPRGDIDRNARPHRRPSVIPPPPPPPPPPPRPPPLPPPATQTPPKVVVISPPAVMKRRPTPGIIGGPCPAVISVDPMAVGTIRSEERRVGKECRS